MGVGFLFFNIIGVVGRNEWNTVFLRPLDKNRICSVFIFLAMSHEFDVQIIPKLLLPPEQGFFCLWVSHIQYFGGNFSIHVTSEHYKIVLELQDDLFIYPRDIIESIRIGQRSHLNQILIPFFIFG